MSRKECDSDTGSSEEDFGYGDYYNLEGGCDIDQIEPNKTDPEYFVFECLSVEEVERLLNESVETLSNNLQITPSLAKVFLHAHSWNIQEIVVRYEDDASQLLALSKVNPPHSSFTCEVQCCPVCLITQSSNLFRSLACSHPFCNDCWSMHFEVQILQGVSTGIRCMAQDCEVLAPEDFVLGLVRRSNLREKYQQFAFRDYVRTHPELRFCPGPNCQVVFRAKELKGKRVTCNSCRTSCCFQCGMDYHAPTDCNTITKWMMKCADDSETANYLKAYTKSCPNCQVFIEKKGGCNHMQCYNCNYEFCWMCMGDWKSHGSEYYECSRYKVNPDIAQNSMHGQAKEALKRYLHYYERWDNHSRSLKLEEQTLMKIKLHINEKIMNGSGTWIDWQYLMDGAALLAKCRYTLQFTYPYAYFMEPGPWKELFEYQQAQLESEIENLSWKIERAETMDRSNLENQMDVVEKRRVTLLKDFLQL